VDIVIILNINIHLQINLFIYKSIILFIFAIKPNFKGVDSDTQILGKNDLCTSKARQHVKILKIHLKRQQTIILSNIALLHKGLQLLNKSQH
jgi:hypothetical protein